MNRVVSIMAALLASTASALAQSPPNSLSLSPTVDSLYVQPGEAVVVDMNVANLLQPVSGCQALLGYSSYYFPNPGTVAAGGGVWGELIYEHWVASGELDTAIGVTLEGGPPGTDADGTVAIINLVAGTNEGTTLLGFRSDPDTLYATMFSDLNAEPVWPAKADSPNIIIDGTPPVVGGLTAVQSSRDVLNCASTTLQGSVTITVNASDALAGLAGEPQVTVSQGLSSLPVSALGEGPAGTFSYAVTIDPATANGTWQIAAVADDRAGNSAGAIGTLCVNKNRISGQLSTDTLRGNVYSFSRTVTFQAADVHGIILKSWTMPLTFTNNPNPDANPLTFDPAAFAGYSLDEVPDGTAALLAKTNWTLRRRVAAILDGQGQAIANFTGAHRLLGGDLNGSNYVNTLDYVVLKTTWGTTGAAGDINGDGFVQTLDYALLKANWFKPGD